MDISGSRLRLARQRRGFTLIELAKRIGVSPPSLSSYETGERAAPPNVALALADALRFPLGFFELPEVELLEGADRASPEASAASFRALRSLTARAAAQALSGAVIGTELWSYFAEGFDLPPLALPTVGARNPALAATITRGMQDLADEPVSSMVDVLETMGVRLLWMRNECREVDAFCFWRDGDAYVVLSQDKSAEHAVWDAAHELGHLLLHPRTGAVGRAAEDEANAFAAGLLLPEVQFRRECGSQPSHERISELKRRWRVPRGAVVRRAHELGLLSDWAYRSEFIAMNRRGKYVEDDPIEPEESALVPGMLDVEAAEGTYLEDIANTLRLNVVELCNFIPATPSAQWFGTLPDRPPSNVLPLRSRQG